MLGDASRVEELAAEGAGEAESVVHLSQTLHLFGKIHFLVTPGTHARHSKRFFLWKKVNIFKQFKYWVNKQYQYIISIFNPIDFHD